MHNIDDTVFHIVLIYPSKGALTRQGTPLDPTHDPPPNSFLGSCTLRPSKFPTFWLTGSNTRKHECAPRQRALIPFVRNIRSLRLTLGLEVELLGRTPSDGPIDRFWPFLEWYAGGFGGFLVKVCTELTSGVYVECNQWEMLGSALELRNVCGEPRNVCIGTEK